MSMTLRVMLLYFALDTNKKLFAAISSMCAKRIRNLDLPNGGKATHLSSLLSLALQLVKAILPYFSCDVGYVILYFLRLFQNHHRH